MIASEPMPAPAVLREYAETGIPCTSVPRAQYTSANPLPETVQITLPTIGSASVAGFPPWLGEIYDQDTLEPAMRQHGLRNGGNADVMFSAYQEVRIRHLHQTLAWYLEQPPRSG